MGVSNGGQPPQPVVPPQPSSIVPHSALAWAQLRGMQIVVVVVAATVVVVVVVIVELVVVVVVVVGVMRGGENRRWAPSDSRSTCRCA